MLERKGEVRLLKNKLFFNNKGDLIRVFSLAKRSNTVYIFNYTNFSKESIEYDTAVYYLTPAFRIGDLSKIIDRKPDTIRKYEKVGLLPKPRKVLLNEDGSASIRIYSLKDISDILDILSTRNQSGRPTQKIYVDHTNALKHINARFQKIKNIGK